MKKKVNEKGGIGVVQLIKLLRSCSKEKQGELNREEFKQAWRELKIGFDDSDLGIVFDECDNNRTSFVNINTFFNMIKVNLSNIIG